MRLLLGKRAPLVRPRSLTFAPCQWLAHANADMSRGMTSPQARSVVKVRSMHDKVHWLHKKGRSIPAAQKGTDLDKCIQNAL